MNKKITRIMGAVLSLTMLLGSLVVPAAPASAAPGEQQWFQESLPSGSTVAPYSTFFLWPGASIADFAVADATTLYAAVFHAVAAERGVFKSTNAGNSWSKLPAFPTEAAQNAVLIAVAPDNVNAIAIVDSANGFHVSNDGGTTWSTLPAIAPAGQAMDLAVGPARSGTLLSREYFVAISDPGAAAVALGDCAMIGATAAWQSVAAAGITATYDVTSVAISPNFLGDRCVVIVGTTAAAGSTAAVIVNTATRTIVNPPGAVALNPAGTTIDFGGAVVGIQHSDIALPSNFDPTSASGRRAYVGIATAGALADEDVFRVDNDSPRALGAASVAGIYSVAYQGTIDAGKLFFGQRDNNNVRWTDAPTTSSPTWTTTTKGPNSTAANPMVVVELAADFATSSKVFAGTSGGAGNNNEFAVSTDAGVSFNGEAFIDAPAKNVNEVQGVRLSNDGKTIFMCTDDGANLNLWKSATSVSGTSWSRVLFVNGGTAGMLTISPEYTTTPAVFFANLVAGGAIFSSQNGGATFANRMQPTGVTFTAMTAQDANVIYGGDATGNVYKSTNAGWTWATPVPGRQTGAIASMFVPRFDEVLVGGTAGASYSVDGAANFTAINTGLTGAGAVFITSDFKYQGNKTIYAGGAGSNIVYRYVIGTSSQWENLANPTAAAVVGVEQANGTLYALSAASVDRALDPTEPVGSIDWSVMNVGAAVAAATFLTTYGGSTENVVYAGNNIIGTPRLYSYKDVLGVAKPDITSLADKETVAVDPVSGRGDAINIMFKKLGSGTGLVNSVDIEIRQKTTGLTGVATWAAFAVATESPSALITGPTALTAFLANTEYVWAIRAANTVSLDAVNSNWTAARTFTVQSGGAVIQEQSGVIVTSPQAGAMNVDPTLVAFTWAPVFGATEYTVIVATDAALTSTVAGTPVKVTTTSFQATALDYEKTYFYSIQPTAPTIGEGKIGSFSTKAKPAPPVTTTPPPPVTPQIVFPQPATPAWVWAVIVIGAVLIIAVIVLIVRTRRVP